ncbi:MAG: DNA repair protein RecO [Coriobacteriia bacterium]|nr:DNA repair protein RecO [Coriobacteriia bacterium]
MAQTYAKTGLVLKTTKLGETDLILTMLGADGSLIKGVAKGARNPKSKNVGRTDVFMCCDLLLAKGKSLDIIVEMRTVNAYRNLRESYELSLLASTISEIAFRIAMPDNPEEMLYQMTIAAFDNLSEFGEERGASLMLGFFMKAMAVQGYRPSFEYCAVCSEEYSSYVGWSAKAGGVICESCALHFADLAPFNGATVEWMKYLLMSTFSQIGETNIEKRALEDISKLMLDFFEYNFAATIKSLPIYWSLCP